MRQQSIPNIAEPRGGVTILKSAYPDSIRGKTSLKQKILLIIFGLFLCFLLLEIGLRVGGLVFLSLQEHRNRITVLQKGTYRIVCLGESTTAIGGENSYPRQLERILNQKNIGIKFSVINKGLIGTDTTHIMGELRDYLNKYNPDMVITMMGINDAWDTLSQENIPTPKNASFFQSFRIYKLIKLLRLHIIKRVEKKGLGTFKIMEKKENNLITDKDDKILKKAVEANPKNIEAYLDLAIYYQEHGPYDRTEEVLKRAIELNPTVGELYLILVDHYLNQGAPYKAEETADKATAINLKMVEAYSDLAWWYVNKMEYDKAEEIFKKAMEMSPESPDAYTELGKYYSVIKKDDHKAVEMFLKAIETAPEDAEAYSELGKYYVTRGEHDKGEGLLRKAINIDPQEYDTYKVLAEHYSSRKEFWNTVGILKKAIEMNPKNTDAYIELGKYYKIEKQHDKAEETFKAALTKNPQSDILFNELSALLFEKQVKAEPREKGTTLTEEIRSKYYAPKTKHNYQRLKQILSKRGIQLVCAQYPLRDVKKLEGMFEDQGNIIFVDNEKVFKEALKPDSYDAYFVDRFAGDFGHCTAKGNKLLAENIANVLVEKYFEKILTPPQ